MTDPFVRPDVAAFLGYLNNMPGPKMHELEPAAARQLYLATKGVAEVPQGELAVVRDLSIPGPAGAIPARLFDAADRHEAGPAVVFFHGGGFVIGDLDTHASFCAEAARVLDVPVIAIDYRLAPEHRWPAAPDDCEAAARWVATSPPELKRSVTGLVLMGDSAGGALTIVTAIALRDEPATVPVLVQAPIYPVVDRVEPYGSYDQFNAGYLLTRESMSWFEDAYAADLDHMRASPIRADLTGLPPCVIVTAGLDPLRDQGRRYAATLIEKGIPTIYREASGNIHGFINMRQAIPSGQGDVTGYLTAVRAMLAEQVADA
ncbi:acetyl esterase [Sphingomonas jinjuensis]|uniref:Acetyl esterase n=1 Tax=Sphingomonas jinjuensis TaxID=535907 RepID=A0A840FLS9_9SPHN|nr:alpha/beta hydrolase [Sphingomonas jinjuensis]MBB4154265.1 acetyl esterase [Sphingomonas jinjuensis]